MHLIAHDADLPTPDADLFECEMETSMSQYTPNSTSLIPGDRVLACGRRATVKQVLPTGAITVLTDGGAVLTFVEGVIPLPGNVAVVAVSEVFAIKVAVGDLAPADLAAAA